MKFKKDTVSRIGILFVVGFLIISLSGFAYATNSESKSNIDSKVIKDMAVVVCAILMECSGDASDLLDDIQRQPENRLLTDGEIFEKMVLDNVQIQDKIDELSSNFKKDIKEINHEIIRDPKFQEYSKQLIELQIESIRALSPMITELQFRGYVFNPMMVKGQECLTLPTIEFPKIEMPTEKFSDFEFLVWSHENKQKIMQFNKNTEWFFGVNFENVPSVDDKKIIEMTKTKLIDFEESLTKFEKNPNQANLTILKESLAKINQDSKNYEGKFIIVLLDISEDHKKVRITSSIETKDLSHSDNNRKCLNDFRADLNSDSSSDYKIQNIDASESQISVPITFPTYSDESYSVSPEEHEYGLVYSNAIKSNTIQSLKKQISVGVTSENISCKNGLNLIFKSTDSSPACVKSETAKKLIHRGWTVS